jgi:RNA polymerase sigma-70 factor (ECF subfamily)
MHATALTEREISEPTQADRRAEDEGLLQGILAGREPDLEAAFRRYYRQVHDLLYRMVGDEADDLAQEVFWRLHTRPPRALTSDLGAWLYRVATRLGYNALRAARRRERHRQGWGAQHGEWDAQREPSPEAALERVEVQEHVRVAVARLTRREASLLLLRQSGMSYRELAQAVGVAPGSVGALLARAERAFARHYAGRDDPQGGAR